MNKYIKVISGLLFILVILKPLYDFENIAFLVENEIDKYSMEITDETISYNLENIENKIIDRALENETNGY